MRRERGDAPERPPGAPGRAGRLRSRTRAPAPPWSVQGGVPGASQRDRRRDAYSRAGARRRVRPSDGTPERSQARRSPRVPSWSQNRPCGSAWSAREAPVSSPSRLAPAVSAEPRATGQNTRTPIGRIGWPQNLLIPNLRRWRWCGTPMELIQYANGRRESTAAFLARKYCSQPCRIRARHPQPPSVRFWSKVSGGTVDECWVWTAGNVQNGYASFRPDAGGVLMLAHRFAYEDLRAQIPEGLQLDHLCRNTLCVNPWHLEPVTPRVNSLRSSGFGAVNAAKTECVHGHRFTPENTRITKRGKRSCRTCAADRERERRKAAGAFATGTHCRAGHAYDDFGIIEARDGRRYCRGCRTRNPVPDGAALSAMDATAELGPR